MEWMRECIAVDDSRRQYVENRRKAILASGGTYNNDSLWEDAYDLILDPDIPIDDFRVFVKHWDNEMYARGKASPTNGL